jgi:fructose-specific component phosphotransferase system IIB-like protein
MPIEESTPLLNLPLPHKENQLVDDVQRVRDAFSLVDSIVEGKAESGDIDSHIASQSNPHGATAAQVGAIPDSADAVTDSHIGNRSADSGQVPSGSVGNLTQWVNWLTNRIRTITGTANWYDSPSTTLTEAFTHAADISNPHGTTAAQVGAISDSADTVADGHIGSRTADQAQTPSGNSGTLNQWLNWIANRIRTITGAADWYDAPATTLAAAAAHAAGQSNPHATTAAQTGALPLSGGTMTGPMEMSNNAVTGVKTVGFNAEYSNGNSGSSKTISLANGQKQVVTLTANTTLTISAASAVVGNYLIRIKQDAIGNRLVTWSGLSASRWLGSSSAPAINLFATGETLLSIYFDGANMIQSIAKVGES